MRSFSLLAALLFTYVLILTSESTLIFTVRSGSGIVQPHLRADWRLHGLVHILPDNLHAPNLSKPYSRRSSASMRGVAIRGTYTAAKCDPSICIWRDVGVHCF